jgi:hypothetical protein
MSGAGIDLQHTRRRPRRPDGQNARRRNRGNNRPFGRPGMLPVTSVRRRRRTRASNPLGRGACSSVQHSPSERRSGHVKRRTRIVQTVERRTDQGMAERGTWVNVLPTAFCPSFHRIRGRGFRRGHGPTAVNRRRPRPGWRELPARPEGVHFEWTGWDSNPAATMYSQPAFGTGVD